LGKDAAVAAKTSSLFPYLDSEKNRFYLRLLLDTQDVSALQRLSHPFLNISDSNPFARLIEAEFVTDRGSKVKDVCLLVQKDCHVFGKDSLWPVTNGEIDRLWNDTFRFYSKDNRNGSIITLGDQLDENGRLIPFDPLFYCKVKQQYFHPPCPRCGMPLRQCRDETVLASSGLSPYSSSLKRYLYCAACLAASDDPRFYTLHLESTDPRRVTDLNGLIRGFGELAQKRPALSEFPCSQCPNLPRCYGADGLACNSIVPFSFYAFHLLMFEAPSLSAPDFLALVAGASFAELAERLAQDSQPGRLNRLQALGRNELPGLPFVFDGEKHFWEVLYLKLSFLSELARIVLVEAAAFRRDIDDPAIDSIWIRLDADGRRLPYTWSFKVDIIDMVRGIPDDSPPPLGPYSRYREFLGLVWFYTLLVNKQQNLAVVYRALRKIMERPEPLQDWPTKDLADEEIGPTLAPRNVFWNPEGRPVGESCASLWGRSLELGFSLLADHVLTEGTWSKQWFCQELETLREGVKAQLFQPQPTEERGELPAEVEAIVPILERIRERWAAALQSGPIEMDQLATVAASELPARPLLESVGYADDIITETIIISPAKPISESDGAAFEETRPPAGVSAGPSVLGAELLKSASGDTGPGKPPRESPSAEVETLPETVILGAAKPELGKVVLGGAAAGAEGLVSPASEAPAEDFLAATVMVGAEKLEQKGPEKADKGPIEEAKPLEVDAKVAEDGLLETVLIVPAKPKPKGQKDSNE
jgi:hypothetical protein